MNHPNYSLVASLIRGYYNSLNDPWRHDFAESEAERQEDDSSLLEAILNDITKYLEVDRNTAENLLDSFD